MIMMRMLLLMEMVRKIPRHVAYTPHTAHFMDTVKHMPTNNAAVNWFQLFHLKNLLEVHD